MGDDRLEQDQALLAAVLSGRGKRSDHRALVDALMPAIQGSVLRVLRKRRPMGSFALDQACADVVQIVFEKLYRDDKALLARWDPARGYLASYVAGIARNTALDWSKQRQRADVPYDDAIDGKSVDAPIKSLEETVIAQQEGNRLWRTVSKWMSDMDQKILRMAAIEGRTGDEIAEATGLSRGAVHVRYHRLIAKLRRALGRKKGES